MGASSGRPAQVQVDYSQYQVAAGPDMVPGDDIIPGLLADMGPQAVAVLTGLQWGAITVTAGAVTEAPAGLDPGWDVAAETDLDCPEGIISVLDWGGPDHPELGDLAIAGPGRYRLRVHARNRENTDQKHSAEEHYLLLWPVTESAPPRLLTGMDPWGQLLAGGEPDDTPPLDAVELAAAAAVRRLAGLVTQPDPPALTGQLTTVRAQAAIPGTPRKVWNLVSAPWNWLGNSGGTDPARFYIRMLKNPDLEARGGLFVDEPSACVAFTWSWTTTRWVEADQPMPVAQGINLMTGEETAMTRTVRGSEPVDSWMLPPDPTTVLISLRRAGKGITAVELEHRDLPVELAGLVQPFWDWALNRELPDRLTKATFHGYPWDR